MNFMTFRFIYGNVINFIIPTDFHSPFFRGVAQPPTRRVGKWVITPVINGISRVNPLIAGVL